ncbi:BnaA06g24910D [Brassica napus]|uniref:BnaA06g24910D protein n=1 Tax=Brassica napus TaxID=3708 RepID=A0A078FAB8_BRANA|nr:BnaA06g24910D [Brassica napus]
MGNCQAAEAATVLIHHPAENKVERIYWSVTASDVMKSNPGHYVAVVVTSPTLRNEKGSPLKQLKLLQVLKEFATKKCVKLGKLLKEGGGLELKKKTKKHRKKTDQDHNGRVNPNSDLDPKEDVSNDDTVAGEDGGDGFMRRSHGGGRGGGGWRPSLHSIPELGSS